MAGNGSNAAQTPVSLELTRDEYNDVVYSVATLAGAVAVEAARTGLSIESSGARRYAHLLGLQSRIIARGGFDTTNRTMGESPPKMEEASDSVMMAAAR